MENGNSNDNDFTFCQVGLPTDQKGMNTNNLASDIGGITIKDESSTSTDSSQNGGFRWKDKQPNNATSGKEATVGSLTFNVVDASCLKPFSESSRQVTSADAGASGKNAEKPKVSTRKPAPRTKVPFEKGYSQLDWLKLTQTHPDLAGVDMLMKAVGQDCTSLFNKYHAWVNAEFLLEKCLVGTLDDSEGSTNR